MEVIVTMCWAIWIVRNDAIFWRISLSLLGCKIVFRKEFALVILIAKKKLKGQLSLWLEAFM